MGHFAGGVADVAGAERRYERKDEVTRTDVIRFRDENLPASARIQRIDGRP